VKLIRFLYVFVYLLFYFFVLVSCGDNFEKNKSNNEIRIRLNSSTTSILLNYKVKNQTSSERVWRNIKIKKKLTIGEIDDTLLLMPIKLRTDNKNNIYVLDQASKSVKKFNEKGKLIAQYGKNGKGPGEVILPMSFDVSRNSDIVISDISLKRCVIFQGKNRFIVNLKYTPLGVCFISKNDIAVLQCDDIREFSNIERFNFSGELSHSYDRLVIINGSSKMKIIGPIPAFVGELYADKDGIYYLPKYMNHIIHYSNSGQIKYSNSTIDYLPLPMITKNVKKTANNLKIISGSANLPKEQLSYIISTIVEDYIIILSRRGTLEYNIPVFDFYSKNTGIYLFSIKFKELGQFVDLSFNKEHIYILRPNMKIQVFDYKISK